MCGLHIETRSAGRWYLLHSDMREYDTNAIETGNTLKGDLI